jgi:hypothetical protein
VATRVAAASGTSIAAHRSSSVRNDNARIARSRRAVVGNVLIGDSTRCVASWCHPGWARPAEYRMNEHEQRVAASQAGNRPEPASRHAAGRQVRSPRTSERRGAVASGTPRRACPRGGTRACGSRNVRSHGEHMAPGHGRQAACSRRGTSRRRRHELSALRERSRRAEAAGIRGALRGRASSGLDATWTSIGSATAPSCRRQERNPGNRGGGAIEHCHPGDRARSWRCGRGGTARPRRLGRTCVRLRIE